MLLGHHTGGFTPFAFEVTEAMAAAGGGSHTLLVRVLDPTDGTQLRGKQSPQAEGIFYTRASGIWQSVWLETVPAAAHVDEVVISADLEAISLRAVVSLGAELRAEVGAEEAAEGTPLPLVLLVAALP